MPSSDDRPILPLDQIKNFHRIASELDTFYQEIGIISKKKPGEVLNKFKLGFLNQTLVKANVLLEDEFRPFPDFTTFDMEASLPTASDAVMMIAHYQKAMGRFRAKFSSKSSSYASTFDWNRVEADEPEDSDDFGDADDFLNEIE